MLIRTPSILLARAAENYARGLPSMDSGVLTKRDEKPDGQKLKILIVGAVIGGFLLLGITWLYIRSLRARYPEPKYVPTPFLKRIWTRWTPSTMNYQQPASDSDGRWGGASRNASSGLSTVDGSGVPMRTSPQSADAVNRHTSVRSIMTLPAYRSKANDGEEVLGVAGERDGIDVVVEMTTAEQEEAMRDREMDALFQIRQARYRQIAEREELRARRDQARAANDLAAERAIRQEARNARSQNADEIEALRSLREEAQHTRERAVSAVSYAGIGEVRHDGSRARANSQESERVGLLSDAASIAASTRPSTILSARRLSSQGRGRSSSVMSIETAHSQPGSRSSSRSATPAASPRALPDSEDADLGNGAGGTLPPDYEEVSLSDGAAGPPRGVPSRHGTPSHDQQQSSPPPEYSGPVRNADYHRMSRHVADLLAPRTGGSAQSSPDLSSSSAQRGGDASQGGSTRSTPTLPNLSFQTVPQIVIEPSTAGSETFEHRRL